MSGAYQFDVVPGDETVVDVRTRLYLRAPVGTLGIAPLTSMYQFGENQPHRIDFRPEVHDSDGLMVATGAGEWLWRPLLNPRETLTTSFSMSDLKRIRPDAARPELHELRGHRGALRAAAERVGRADGLVGPGPRRARADLYAGRDERQHRRVLGAGAAAGARRAARARLSPALAGPRIVQQPPGAWVTQSRVGRGYRELADDEQQFIVDFMGRPSRRYRRARRFEAVVSAPANGEILETNAYTWT